MRKKSGIQTLTLALSGMMAALVFVATYFFKLPVSITQGYIHLGDGFILLGASLLGWASVPAAAIGSALADLLGGYTLYILPTFVIRGWSPPWPYAPCAQGIPTADRGAAGAG